MRCEGGSSSPGCDAGAALEEPRGAGLYAHLLRTSLDGFWLIGEDGRLLDVNDAYCQMSGYTRQELLCLSIADLEAVESPEETRAHLRRLLETGADRFESRHRAKSGHVYDVEVSTSVDPAGGRVAAFIRDISKRKQSEEVLAARLRLMAFAETSTLAELLRRTLDEAESLTGSQVGFYHFVEPDENTLWLQAWSTNTVEKMCTAEGAGLHYAVEKAGIWAECIRERRAVVHNDYATARNRKGLPEGHAPVIRELVVPVFRHGKITAVLGVGNKPAPYREDDIETATSLADLAWDVAERKRANEEKLKLQDRVVTAERMESIGRLAGGVAHDFNNMLSVILGHAEEALPLVDTESALHAGLLEIRAAAERSAALTQQLLAFARRQTVVPKVLDLNAAIERMLRMLDRLIGEEIELSWRPDPGLWPVKLDPTQVDQILANLCVNARDAIEGPGHIQIETTRVPRGEVPAVVPCDLKDRDHVVLRVADDGCGMDRHTLEHVFEPFFSTKGSGTGLGLATVYGIVRQNEGFIDVTSEPGKGTAFSIYFPRYLGREFPVAPKNRVGDVPTGRETVLLVEDEVAILKLERALLEKLGYTVLAASRPGEAIQIAREHSDKIDLLITDVVIPEMNGRDLTARIQSLQPGIRSLYISGYPAEVIARRGLADDGIQFVQKPFSVMELATKVREVLETARVLAAETR